jgi:hypothetical protein
MKTYEKIKEPVISDAHEKIISDGLYAGNISIATACRHLEYLLNPEQIDTKISTRREAIVLRSPVIFFREELTPSAFLGGEEGKGVFFDCKPWRKSSAVLRTPSGFTEAEIEAGGETGGGVSAFGTSFFTVSAGFTPSVSIDPITCPICTSADSVTVKETTPAAGAQST